MSLPADLTLVPVAIRTFVNRAGDVMAGKRITATLETEVSVGLTTIVPKRLTITLDDEGKVPEGTTLPSTNDPDLSITGLAYTIEEKWAGGRTGLLVVPYDADDVDLADLVDTVPQIDSGIEQRVTALVADAEQAVSDAEGHASDASDSAAAAAASAATLSDAVDDIAGMKGGASVSDQQLKDWTLAEAIRWISVTRNTAGVATSASIAWPDGSAGTFTATTINATFNAIDAFTITHTSSGRIVTQAAVTRDSAGNISYQPALAVGDAP